MGLVDLLARLRRYERYGVGGRTREMTFQGQVRERAGCGHAMRGAAPAPGAELHCVDPMPCALYTL